MKIQPLFNTLLVEDVIHPDPTKHTSEELNQKLLVFCMNCPDPISAMDLVVECMTPMSAQELVDKALSYPPRHVADVPESVLPACHPFRYMTADWRPGDERFRSIP